MAYFKELTDIDGSKVILNVDHINSMKPANNGTIITLTNGAITVKQTPAEIVTKGEFEGTPEPAQVSELKA